MSVVSDRRYHPTMYDVKTKWNTSVYHSTHADNRRESGRQRTHDGNVNVTPTGTTIPASAKQAGDSGPRNNGEQWATTAGA